ncbi:hypothetical protein TURU_064963 [Turdus rufiventris]|nr:hypothetical protein TURU_064963 [Turdus rufiventris]
MLQPVRARSPVKSVQTNRLEILGFSQNQPHFQQIVVWIPILPLAFQFSPCLPQLDSVCCFWTEMLNKILVPQGVLFANVASSVWDYQIPFDA